MSEEVEIAVKMAAETVAALAEKSGALTVPAEFVNYLATRIRLHFLPALEA